MPFTEKQLAGDARRADRRAISLEDDPQVGGVVVAIEPGRKFFYLC